MKREQTMSTKFTKSLLAVSPLSSLVAMSANAYAGSTISDRRYWPSEVGPRAYSCTQAAPRDAFAAIGPTTSAAVAPAAAREESWHYVGGPKSSVAASRGF